MHGMSNSVGFPANKTNEKLAEGQPEQQESEQLGQPEQLEEMQPEQLEEMQPEQLVEGQHE